MLTTIELQRIATAALTEDAPWGDVTSEAIIPADQRGSAKIVARESGVMACGEIIDAVYASVGGSVDVVRELANGDTFQEGDVLATISGPVRALLLGERVTLNLVQRACGIATITSQYVKAVADTRARIIDTRKTTPGLRSLEKEAVVAGGGFNHRFSLSDAVMIKDNHLAAWRAGGVNITEGLRDLKAKLGHTTHIEVEIDDLATLAEVLESDAAGSVLLDNFSLEDTSMAVKTVDGACLLVASGRVNLTSVAAIAATGVDLISVGALTHSAQAIDIGVDFV